jgi:uracil-DNA glycosylase
MNQPHLPLESQLSTTLSSAVPAALTATPKWEMHTRPTVHRPDGKTLLILGEAPGADEEISGIPFVGSAGRMLTDAFNNAGLDRREWHILNTFLKRPPNNDLKDTSWTLNKTEWKREYGSVPHIDPPPLKKRFLRPEHHWQVAELRSRLSTLKPDLILAMGATALWALSGEDAITSFRGNFFTSPYGRAIATLHPASVLYQYSNLPILWADLVKVRMYLAGELPQPLRRRLWVNPTIGEIAALYFRWKAMPPARLGVDIETCPAIGQITTVAFSSPTEGICIPFWDRNVYDAARQNYWKTAAEEAKAWRWVKAFAELPSTKVMQNGMYDSQYFLDAPQPIRLTNWTEDTAVMQHAYQPELPKALGVLGSLYLNEPGWKQMRASAKDTNKADE